ncbi:hypothetical protein RYX36_004123 [Vicia faba]
MARVNRKTTIKMQKQLGTINSSIETFKSVDKKYHVTDITKSVAAATEESPYADIFLLEIDLSSLASVHRFWKQRKEASQLQTVNKKLAAMNKLLTEENDRL